MLCYRHKKVETAVRCSKCDRPICPRCMVTSPVGMRCPDCASLRGSPLYQIPPARLILAGAAGLITGIVGAYILTMIGFLVFFLGPLYGGLVSEAVLRAAGRKRGRSLEIIGIGSIVIGALIVYLPRLLLLLHPNPLGGFASLGLLWPAIGFVLAVSTCYSRLKFW